MLASISRRSFAAGLALVAVGAIATGCGKKGDDIPVGAYLSLSGSDSTFGTDTRDGIELAVARDERGRRRQGQEDPGHLRGRQVHPARGVEQGAPAHRSRQRASRSSARSRSSRSMAGGLIANTQARADGHAVVHRGGGHARIATTSSAPASPTTQQGDVAARFVHDTLKKKKVARVLRRAGQLLVGPRQGFRESFKKLGGEIVDREGLPEGARRTSRPT